MHLFERSWTQPFWVLFISALASIKRSNQKIKAPFYINQHSALQCGRANLNKSKQDSKELSPRSLDKMLLKLQVNSQNVQSTQLLQFIWFSNIAKLVQFNNMILKQVQTCSDSIWDELWFIWFLNTSKLVQIQMIHMILKHV